MTPTDRTTATDAEFVARFAPFDPALAAPVLPVTAWLQQLDELRAAATPGPWHVGMESCDCGNGYPCGHEDYPYELVGPKRTDPSPNFRDRDNLVSEIAQLTTADAALIVAAVNALPELIAEVRRQAAAVRAVLAVVDALDDSCEPGVRNLVDAPTVSRAIRAAIGSVTT